MHKYWAFISYSHADSRWADWLHRSLETYRPPKALIGTQGRSGVIPKQLFPVFRDREELPTSSDLGGNISDALRDSRFLIVICSPRAAQSRWVGEEIKTFKHLGRAEHILCLIVDGEPNATGKPGCEAEECFPKQLRYDLDADGNECLDRPIEPIAADLRPGKDRPADARLKLIAGLLGVDYDALRQRERRRRRKRFFQRALIASAVVAIFAGGMHWIKADAERNGRKVESGKLTIQAQRLSAQDENGKALAYLAAAMRKDRENFTASELTYQLLSEHTWPVITESAPPSPARIDPPQGWTIADSSYNVRNRLPPPAARIEEPNPGNGWPGQFGQPGDWLAVRQKGEPHRLEVWRVGEGPKWSVEFHSMGEPLIAFDASGKMLYGARRSGTVEVQKQPDNSYKILFPVLELTAWEVESGNVLPAPLHTPLPRGLAAICGAISGDRSTILLPGAEQTFLSRNGWPGPFEPIPGIVDVQEAVFTTDGSIVVVRYPAKLEGAMQIERSEIRAIAPKARQPVGFPWLLSHRANRMWLTPDAGRLLVDADSSGLRTLRVEDLVLFKPEAELPGITSDAIHAFTRNGAVVGTMQGMRLSDFTSRYASEPIPPSAAPLRIGPGGRTVDREGLRWTFVKPRIGTWTVSGSSRIVESISDGSQVMTASADGVVSYHRLGGGRFEKAVGLPGQIIAVAPAGIDSVFAAVRSSANQDQIFHIGPASAPIVTGPFDIPAEFASMQAEATRVCAVNKAGEVLEWNLAAAPPTPRKIGSVKGAGQIYFAPSGDIYAALAGDKLWTASADSGFAPALEGIYGVAQLGSGTFVTVEKSSASLWRWLDHKPWIENAGHWPWQSPFQVEAERIVLDAKDNLVAIGSGATLAVLDLEMKVWRFPPVPFPADIARIAIAPDFATVIVACQDRSLHFHSLKTGEPVRSPLAFSGAIRGITALTKQSTLVQLDGRLIATETPETANGADLHAAAMLAEAVGGWKLNGTGGPEPVADRMGAIAAAREELAASKHSDPRWAELGKRLLAPEPYLTKLNELAAWTSNSSPPSDETGYLAQADRLNTLAAEFQLPLIDGDGFDYAFTPPPLISSAERETPEAVVRKRQAEKWRLEPDEIKVLGTAAVRIKAAPASGESGAARLYRDARARLLVAEALNKLLLPGEAASPGVERTETIEKPGNKTILFRRKIDSSTLVIDRSGVRIQYRQVWKSETEDNQPLASGEFRRVLRISVDRIARALLMHFAGGRAPADIAQQNELRKRYAEEAAKQLNLPLPSERYLFVGLSAGNVVRTEGTIDPIAPMDVEERMIEAANETLGGGIILDLETNRIVAFGGGAANIDWAPVLRP